MIAEITVLLAQQYWDKSESDSSHEPGQEIEENLSTHILYHFLSVFG